MYKGAKYLKSDVDEVEKSIKSMKENVQINRVEHDKTNTEEKSANSSVYKQRLSRNYKPQKHTPRSSLGPWTLSICRAPNHKEHFLPFPFDKVYLS